MSFSLAHLVRKPRTAPTDGKPPVLILLHGVGSNEHDLMGLAPELDERFLIVSARAPITLQQGSYAWFHVQFVPDGFLIDPEEAEGSRKKVLAFVDEVVAQYDVDPARVFLGGFSQGCIMSLYSSLTEPEKFTGGIVGMSGRLLPEALPNAEDGDRLKNLQITVVHGTEDPVIPIRFGREIRDRLSKLPLKKFDYKEYRMGHYVSPESMSDISQWLTERLNHRQ